MNRRSFFARLLGAAAAAVAGVPVLRAMVPKSDGLSGADRASVDKVIGELETMNTVGPTRFLPHVGDLVQFTDRHGVTFVDRVVEVEIPDTYIARVRTADGEWRPAQSVIVVDYGAPLFVDTDHIASARIGFGEPGDGIWREWDGTRWVDVQSIGGKETRVAAAQP